jgi:outer membrane protein OmpA-like peptidoglycan-associated protein
VTIYNRNGDVVRRSRFTPDGEEYVLVYVDESYEEDLLEWRDPALDLGPLQLDIPVSEYVLDADDANEDELVQFFDQPPVERVQRLYSVNEVKRSARLRDMMRRLEIGGLTFETGKATISTDQIASLTNVANAMLDMLAVNPAETFLIEGHTDAVGGEIYNLALSDRRAETVAVILSQAFGVPPENLATQGYGERYLKVRTQESDRRNRRVTIKRITPLISPVARR